MSQATRRPERARSAHSLGLFGFCSMRTKSPGSSTWRRRERAKRLTPRPPPNSFSKATRTAPAAGRSSPDLASVAITVSVLAGFRPEHVADEVEEFFGAVGLGDVGVEAGFERALAVLLARERRQRDAGDGARALVRAQLAQQAPAVERRHREVDDGERRRVRAHGFQRLAAVARLADGVAAGLQDHAQQLPVVVEVFGDEYAVVHRGASEG